MLDLTVVGVQTGAGTIPVPGVVVTFAAPAATGASGTFAGNVNTATTNASGIATSAVFTANATAGSYNVTATRSEERRGGEECRTRWAAYHLKKKQAATDQ